MTSHRTTEAYWKTLRAEARRTLTILPGTWPFCQGLSPIPSTGREARLAPRGRSHPLLSGHDPAPLFPLLRISPPLWNPRRSPRPCGSSRATVASRAQAGGTLSYPGRLAWPVPAVSRDAAIRALSVHISRTKRKHPSTIPSRSGSLRRPPAGTYASKTGERPPGLFPLMTLWMKATYAEKVRTQHEFEKARHHK